MNVRTRGQTSSQCFGKIPHGIIGWSDWSWHREKRFRTPAYPSTNLVHTIEWTGSIAMRISRHANCHMRTMKLDIYSSKIPASTNLEITPDTYTNIPATPAINVRITTNISMKDNLATNRIPHYSRSLPATQFTVKWAFEKHISQEIKLRQLHLWNPLESHKSQYSSTFVMRGMNTCKAVGHSLFLWPWISQIEQVPPSWQSLVKWPGSVHRSQHLKDSKGYYC
jgi:hypothetical protein